MRLYHNSIAFRLMDDICRFGNLPYSALRLYPGRYESIKDAAQKLMRAGYLGVVQDRNIKSLYVTQQGFGALNETRNRCKMKKVERYAVIYHPAKAARTDKLNEARLLFSMAECGADGEYIDSREIKRELEAEAPRASDNLKYSRFAGLWHTEESGMLVYHFGRKNIHLNESGELNVRLRMLETLGQCPSDILPMLILGDDMDAMLSILRYSEWWHTKPKNQRRRMKKVHYHLDVDGNMADYAYFLPVNRCSIPILQMMHSEKWEQKMNAIYESCQEQHGLDFVWALACHLKYLMLHHVCHESDHGKKITVVCYDWQQAAIEKYYREILDHREVWMQVYETKAVEDFFGGYANKLPYQSFKLEREN